LFHNTELNQEDSATNLQSVTETPGLCKVIDNYLTLMEICGVSARSS